MTLKYISKDSLPSYMALSTDVLDNGTINGAGIIGKTVYLTDTSEWKVILPNLKLIPFSYSNGTSGVLPEFVSAEIGTVNDTTLVLTLNENISAINYLAGFTIEINGVETVISSATRQTNHAIIHFVIADAVIATDDVTLSYNSNSGGIISETGYVYLGDITSQTVTNNVAP